MWWPVAHRTVLALEVCWLMHDDVLALEVCWLMHGDVVAVPDSNSASFIMHGPWGTAELILYCNIL